MKNSKPVKQVPDFYLYCMNFDCQISIYNDNVEIRIPLTAENISAKHICKCCKLPMISAIDVEIKNVCIGGISRQSDQPDYHNN